MTIVCIRNEKEYVAAIECIDELWDAEVDTPEYEYFEMLAELIDAYERKQWPVDLPDPVAAIKFHMWQKDLNLTDLGTLLGSPLYAFEVLNRKRRLTLPMVWKLCKSWAVPAESLIKPYKLQIDTLAD